MNKQFFKQYSPQFVIDTRRLVLRKIRKTQRFLKNFGQPYFFDISLGDESFAIQINPYKNGCVDEVIENTGRWEPELETLLKKLLVKGGVFLDIGANIGYHSLAVAKKYSNSVQVYSFEPQPSLCSQINASIKKNNLTNIHVVPFALSNQDGELQINIPEENVGGSSLIPNLNYHIAFKRPVLIQVKTLDVLAKDYGRVNVIKLDVEGFELEVLQGGIQVLRSSRPVIVLEFSPIIYSYSQAVNANAIIDLLEGIGYSFYNLKGEKIDLRKWYDNNKLGQIDVVASVADAEEFPFFSG